MKKKIGEILIAHEVISAEDIGEALALQTDGDPSRLGEILVQQGRLEADALARALAEQKALPYTELSLVSPACTRKVPLSFQHYHGLLPFEESSPGEFCIAVADPMATDAVERARQWLNAKSIQLYVASADEIVRVLSALEDQELVSGEVVVYTGENAAVSAGKWNAEGAQEAASAQQSSTLSEEDLFGSLQFEEEESTEVKVPSPSLAGAKPSLDMAETEADELTQIVRRPGPHTGMERVVSLAEEREITPVSSFVVSATVPAWSPLGEELSELLAERGTEALADAVIRLAERLVQKSILSREEVLEIFTSPPEKKW